MGLFLGLCLIAAIFWPQLLLSKVEGFLRATNELGPLGWVIFAGAQILVAISGVLPASLICVVAGATYGLFGGFALAALGTLTGAVLAFWLSRSIFRSRIERILSRYPRLQSLDQVVAQDGWRLVCLVRVSPVMPFSAASFALGLSSISLKNYVVGTLASLPAMLGYVFMGSMADATLVAWKTGAGPIRWAILIVGMLATLFLVFYLGRIALRVGLVPATKSNPDIDRPQVFPRQSSGAVNQSWVDKTGSSTR